MLAHLYEEQGPGFAERLGACSRSPCGTPGGGAWCSPATASASSRCTTALTGARSLRLRAEGARAPAGLLARDRPGSARGLPRLQLRAGAALDLPRVREAAAGLRARLGAASQDVSSSATPEPRPAQTGEVRTEGEEELAEELRERLRDSVQAHLIADVPVGVLLSGGIDSCTLAALAPEPQAGSARSRSASTSGSSTSEPLRGSSRSDSGPTTTSSSSARTRPSSCRRSPRPSTSRSPTRPRSRPISSRSWPAGTSRSPCRERAETSSSAATTITPVTPWRAGSLPRPGPYGLSSSDCRPRPTRRVASTGGPSASFVQHACLRSNATTPGSPSSAPRSGPPSYTRTGVRWSTRWRSFVVTIRRRRARTSSHA